MTVRRSPTFGLYPWFEEHGIHHLHPEDLEKVRCLAPNGKVLEVVGSDEDYLRLRYGTTEFRARPGLFRPLPLAPRRVGARVSLRSGQTATIRDVFWHFQKRLPMYSLQIDEKAASKRYWETDFAD